MITTETNHEADAFHPGDPLEALTNMLRVRGVSGQVHLEQHITNMTAKGWVSYTVTHRFQ